VAGIAAGDKVCIHSAELEGRIGSRIRRAGIAVEACTADAGIAAVAVLASVGQSTLVGRPGCGHIDLQLGIACLASRLAFLFISTNLNSLEKGLTLLGMLLLCIPL
jgi:hypothetical protein